MPNALKDFAYSTVLTAPSPATTGTSLVVASGEGFDFPVVATDGEFDVTIWPANSQPRASNAERTHVTARSVDTFTLVRGVPPRGIGVGDQIALTLSKSTFKDYPRCVYIYASDSDILTASVITTTETAFAATYTIPSGTLIANKLYRVTIGLELTASGSPATQRFRLRLGGISGTIVADSTAFAPAVNQASRPVLAQFLIQGTAAAGASAPVHTHSMGSGSPVSALSVANTVAQPVNVATNTDLAITPTIQFGANTAGNSLGLNQMLVEEMN